MSPTPTTPLSDIPITPNPVVLVGSGGGGGGGGNNNINSVVVQPGLGLSSSVSESKIRKRSPNWLVQEEEQLASSWLLISQQAEFSSNPSGEAFFGRVAEDFNAHSKFHYRDSDQMKTRWGSLNTATLKFSALYNRIEQNPPAGSSHADWMRIAKQLYFEQNKGHTFKDEAAWEKLRHAPKWSQQSSGSSSTIDFNKSFDHQQQQQSEGSIAVRPSSMTPMNYHQIGTSHQSRSEEPRRLKRRAEDDGSEDLLIDEMTQQIIDQSNSWLSTFERGSLKRSNTSTVSDEKSRIMKESVISEMEFKKSQCQLNDLAILKTSESDCPDEISKEALRLMKIRIKKRYEQAETLIE